MHLFETEKLLRKLEGREREWKWRRKGGEMQKKGGKRRRKKKAGRKEEGREEEGREEGGRGEKEREKVTMTCIPYISFINKNF